MHATLSSNNVVGLSFEKGRHMIPEYIGSLILTIYIHNWLHARPRSDVATIVCLTYFHEIAAPLQLNTYPVWDRALCGSERYPASAYPSSCCFDSFE